MINLCISNFFFGVVLVTLLPVGYTLILDVDLLKKWHPNYKTNASISLSSSNIDSIDISTFDGLTNLQKLYLSSNRLKSLDASHFKSLVNLQELDLSSNRLSYMSKEQSPIKTVSERGKF